jgi:hypothetical protein
MPRFEPQTGHGLQNPRSGLDRHLTPIGLLGQSIAVLLPGEEAYEINQPSAILYPGIEEPAAGNGRRR